MSNNAYISSRVYFYPHRYLRDRQLDTIRRWPHDKVVNPELAERREGTQVSRANALSKRIRVSWKQRLPLINIKLRPSGLPKDVAVYVWGAVVASGPFIVDIDNPYALVGYNVRAMPLWQFVLRLILESDRCLEIRCMSVACLDTLGRIFGSRVKAKGKVVYPLIEAKVKAIDSVSPAGPRFLFVGTQFEIKGGAALLRAFPRVRRAIPTATLALITHLPAERVLLTRQDGVTVHEAQFSREQIWQEFMSKADVLVHPTYVETFGMVVLEALAHGLVVITTDVYALCELVEDERNGRVLVPPLHLWTNGMPGPLFDNLGKAPELAASCDTSQFEQSLAEAMIEVAQNPSALLSFRQNSLWVVTEKFMASAKRPSPAV